MSGLLSFLEVVAMAQGDMVDTLAAYLAQDPANGRSLLNDRERMQAVAADVAASDPALRTALLTVVGQPSFTRVLLAGKSPIPAARADMLKRLDDQGIRDDVAERCVDLLTAAFLGSEVLQDNGSGALQSGWYDDPHAPGGRVKRYWDGNAWTGHTHDTQVGRAADSRTATNEGPTAADLDPPNPKRVPWKKVSLIGGIAASLVLIFIILGAVRHGPEDGDGSNTDPTSEATTDATSEATTDATSEATGLSDAQSDLANEAGWIDSATCKSVDETGDNLVASIQCTSSAGSNFVVIVEKFDSQAALNELFNFMVSDAGANQTDDVMSGTGASWSSWTYRDSPNKTAGSILFHPDYSGNRTDVGLLWSDNETLILYAALADPSMADELKTWWSQ